MRRSSSPPGAVRTFLRLPPTMTSPFRPDVLRDRTSPTKQQQEVTKLTTHAQGLLDVGAVAAFLGCSTGFVYDHADELGARRLGSGPRPRLRFVLSDVQRWLDSCSQSRGSCEVLGGVVAPIQRRRKYPNSGSEAGLLPIRGRLEAV